MNERGARFYALFWQWGDRSLALLIAVAEATIVYRSWHAGQMTAFSRLLPLALALLVSVLMFGAKKRERTAPGVDGILGLSLSLIAPYFFRPNIFVVANHQATLLYSVTNIFYFSFAVWGYLSLKTSIAILPGARPIIASGPYRIIRHPIYATYLHLAVCYTAYFPSIVNALTTIALAIGVLLRVGNEERMLFKSPQYFELKARVPNRYSTVLFSLPAAVTVATLAILQY
jgi:protein-S-isoprenylcysteine O-methyltransferase Ste14